MPVVPCYIVVMADRDLQDVREEDRNMAAAGAGQAVSVQEPELDTLSDEEAAIEADRLLGQIERRLLAAEATTQQLLLRYGLAA
jgi:hypothetical protein